MTDPLDRPWRLVSDALHEIAESIEKQANAAEEDDEHLSETEVLRLECWAHYAGPGKGGRR